MLTYEGIQMYAQLLGEGSAHKSKTRMCAWITDKYAQDKNLKSSLDQLKAALKVLTLLALLVQKVQILTLRNLLQKQISGWEDSML